MRMEVSAKPDRSRLKERSRQVRALVALELRRTARARPTLAALLTLALLLAFGHWEYWSSPAPRPDGDRLFGYAYLLAAMLVLRPGFALDRTAALDEYLVANLTTPACYVTAKLLAAGTVILALGSCAFGLALALSAGDVLYAAWHTALFTLIAWLFLPGIVLVELGVETGFPAVIVAVLLVVALTVAGAVDGVEPALRTLGLRVRYGAFATLAPLTLRGALGVPALLLLIYPLLRRRVAARPPSGHGRSGPPSGAAQY